MAKFSKDNPPSVLEMCEQLRAETYEISQQNVLLRSAITCVVTLGLVMLVKYLLQ